MKKLYFLLISFTMFFAACSSESTVKEPKGQTETKVETSTIDNNNKTGKQSRSITNNSTPSNLKLEVVDGDHVTLNFPNGQLKAKGKRIDGKEEGKWEYFYFSEPGKTPVAREFKTYKNGLFDGEQKYFFEDGLLRSQSFYVDGKRHGEQKQFFANKKIMTHSEFNNGVLKWRKDYFDNGVIKNEIEIVNGKKTVKSYNAAGDLKSDI